MYIFSPGQAKTATFAVTVAPAGLSCEVELFLGLDSTTKASTSGKVPFTSTGLEQLVTLPLTMPAVNGMYHVYMDVYIGGTPAWAGQATQDVVIPLVTYGGVVWS